MSRLKKKSPGGLLQEWMTLPAEGIDEIIQIEEELAEFYNKVKTISRLDSAKDTFQYMVEESFQHAREIEDMKEKFTKPVFQSSAIVDIARKIRESLFTTIVQEKNYNHAIDQMAGTEETIGKIYKSVAAFYSKLSDYYKELSNTIFSIASEETEHQEMLLKKKQKII